MGTNPFGTTQAVDAGDAVEGQGVLKPETNAFNNLPPENQLQAPAPLTLLDWTCKVPSAVAHRGTMVMLPRWCNAAAARALPCYQVAAEQALLAIPRREIMKMKAGGVKKKLSPLCAAINALAFGAYQHGLLTRAQLCSTCSADILAVLKVLGSHSFIEQHVGDIQLAADTAGHSDNTLGQHFTYAGMATSFWDCAAAKLGTGSEPVPSGAGVRQLLFGLASRCKKAATSVSRSTRPTFDTMRSECGAILDCSGLQQLHLSAEEAMAPLANGGPWESIAPAFGAASLLCISATEGESAQMGVLLAALLPGGARQGTIRLLAPAAIGIGGGGAAVLLDEAHVKTAGGCGERLALSSHCYNALQRWSQMRTPLCNAEEQSDNEHGASAEEEDDHAARQRRDAALRHLRLAPFALDLAATQGQLCEKLRLTHPALAKLSCGAQMREALRTRPALVAAINANAELLASKGAYPKLATENGALLALRQASTNAYGLPAWPAMRGCNLSSLTFRWLRSCAITALLKAWEKRESHFLNVQLPPSLLGASDVQTAYKAVAELACTSAPQVKSHYVLSAITGRCAADDTTPGRAVTSFSAHKRMKKWEGTHTYFNEE